MLPLVVGFCFGFVGSIPVAGPIALLVFAYGMQGKNKNAVLVAVGGAIAEAAYAYMAFWGLARLLVGHPEIVANSRGAGALILLGLGVYFLLRRPTKDRVEGPPSGRGRKRSFVLGFTVTALNPTLIVTWTAAATTLFSSGLIGSAPEHALPFALGAFGGIVAWFVTLVALLHRYRARISKTTLDKIVRVVGVLLIGLGLWFAWGAAAYFVRR